MKRIFLLCVLAACGGGSTGDDAGNNPDSGSDATQSNDANTTPDVPLPSDATNDQIAQGDGSINPGQPCDPQNNQCKAGLLCCEEPNHLPDASPTSFVCEPPDQQQQCPKLP